MKKFYIAFACCSLILAGASTALAVTASNNGSGGSVLSVTVATAGAAAFTYSPSPNVYMVTAVDSVAGSTYSVETMNTVPDATTGMVYGATNTSTGGTWTWMGGSS